MPRCLVKHEDPLEKLVECYLVTRKMPVKVVAEKRYKNGEFIGFYDYNQTYCNFKSKNKKFKFKKVCFED